MKISWIGCILMLTLIAGCGREAEARHDCAARLHRIGVMMQVYENQYRTYPPDLGTLAVYGRLPPETFVCPDAGQKLPETELSGPELKTWVNAHTSFVLISPYDLSFDSRNDTVLCYEADSDHGDGVNLLTADSACTVSFHALDDAHRRIEAAKRSAAGPSIRGSTLPSRM